MAALYKQRIRTLILANLFISIQYNENTFKTYS